MKFIELQYPNKNHLIIQSIQLASLHIPDGCILVFEIVQQTTK